MSSPRGLPLIYKYPCLFEYPFVNSHRHYVQAVMHQQMPFGSPWIFRIGFAPVTEISFRFAQPTSLIFSHIPDLCKTLDKMATPCSVKATRKYFVCSLFLRCQFGASNHHIPPQRIPKSFQEISSIHGRMPCAPTRYILLYATIILPWLPQKMSYR
jgi:hypothetical protein